MSYYPELDSHIRGKVRVVLCKQERIRPCYKRRCIWLVAEKKSIALKAQIEKLGINKLVNVLTSLNDLKAKVDDLGNGELKTVPVDLKELSDVVDNEVVKKIFDTLKIKVNNIEMNIPDATTLIHINQYNTDKQNLEKNWRYWLKNNGTGGLVITTVLNTKVSEVENKMPNTSSLVTTTVLNTKINEVENKIPDHAKYITTQEFNKLVTEHFAAKLKQTNLMNKTDFDNKLISFNRKITSK